MSITEYALTPSCSFFLDSGKNGCWNLPMCVEIKRRYDSDAMKKALNRVIAENDAIRCVVSDKHSDGSYSVHFLDNISIEPEIMEITDDCENAREKAIKEAEKFASVPVDACNKIPLKFKCFIFSDSAFLMTIIIHHFVADAVGLAVIGSKIMNYYLNENVSLLDKKTGQFSQYLKKWEEFAVSGKYIGQLKYWEKELNGFTLPACENKFTSKSLNYEHYFVVNRDMIYKFARMNNSTMFNVILLAVNVLYAELFDTCDTVSGFVSSDRRDPEFMASAGNYTRMIGARLTFDSNMSFREALHQLVTKVIHGMENSVAGDNIRPFPIYVSYQEERQTRQFSGTEDVEFIGISIPHSTPCIMMSVIEKKDNIGIGITADGNMYSDDVIENCGKRLTEIIRDMVLTPDRKMKNYLPESVFEKRTSEMVMI